MFGIMPWRFRMALEGVLKPWVGVDAVLLVGEEVVAVELEDRDRGSVCMNGPQLGPEGDL